MKMQIKVTYFTHSGSDGENRDALLVDSVVAGVDMPSCKQIYSASKLFAISDGIGRGKYSKLASMTIVKRLKELGFSLKNLHKIQDELELEGLKDRSKLGSGATLSGVYLDKEFAKIFHVGDGRVYYISDGRAIQLTCDHTQAELLLKGSADLASIYSMLMNYYVYGENEEFFVESKVIRIKEGDKLFICSDGVIEAVKDLQDSLIAFDVNEFCIVDSDDDFSFIYIEL